MKKALMWSDAEACMVESANLLEEADASTTPTANAIVKATSAGTLPLAWLSGTGADTGDAPIWNATTNAWEPGPVVTTDAVPTSDVTVTPTANKIPRADSGAKIALGWLGGGGATGGQFLIWNAATSTWQPSSSGAAITVRDIDGTPSIIANTIRFTNGTVSDAGGGIVDVNVGGSASGIHKVASVVLSANAATVTFDDIPQGYTTLELRWIARGTSDDIGGHYLVARFNDDATAGAYKTLVDQDSYFRINDRSACYIGELPLSRNAAGQAASGVFQMPGYCSSWYKLGHIQAASAFTDEDDTFLGSGALWWLNTAAITKITLFAVSDAATWTPNSNIVTGSEFHLYCLT